ncbi:M1 family metallopeptidase [Planosporangium sp. 12N6]|uniref:M1 family metallopeptidase n=1 Tax=Planosporangium spinosum TaxID=3402278 RepID=UPI003CE6ACD6
MTVLAVALAGTPASAAIRPHAGPTPGSAGGGDSYYPDYGNGGYDVSHYDVRLRYWPETDKLSGTTTVLARATQDLSQFNLDFALAVSSVRVNGWPAAFSREGAHELVVKPARPVLSGQPLTVVVQYADTPSAVRVNGFTSWTRTADGALAVGEPEIAWWWFPSNDHPTDKATFDVSVLVPDGTQVVSNGVMPRPAIRELPGWSRWYWRSVKPMATYLAFLAIGHYEIRTDTSVDGQPVINAYAQDLGEYGGAARASVERTAEVVDWESTVFGPYPFEARGGVVAPYNSMGYALEDQTRPMYDGRFWRNGSNMYVVVHENAHQWFGDSVSLADWRNIWLHEGFASYAEWLWSEAQGEGTAQELFDFTYAYYPADDPFWQVKPGDPGPQNQFHGAVYDRGAMALHQLRLAVGDDVFFRILREWTASHRYGNATIGQFQALAEKTSGKDLAGLFTTWLFTAGRPELGGAATMAARAVPTQPKSWQKIEETHQVLRH